MSVLSEEGYAGAQPVDLESELTGRDTNKVLLDVLFSAGGLAGGSALARKLLSRINYIGKQWPSWASPRNILPGKVAGNVPTYGNTKKAIDATHKAIDDLVPLDMTKEARKISRVATDAKQSSLMRDPQGRPISTDATREKDLKKEIKILRDALRKFDKRYKTKTPFESKLDRLLKDAPKVVKETY